MEEDQLKTALGALSGLVAVGGFIMRQWVKYQRSQSVAIAALVIIAAASFAAEWAYRRWTGRTIKQPACSANSSGR